MEKDCWTVVPARLPACHSTASYVQLIATRLPAELLQCIARYLGHDRAVQAPSKQRSPTRYNIYTRMAILTCRSIAILHVCRAWRCALYGEYSRFTYGDCRLESSAAPLAFLNPASTKEVWLRFDGALLFGSWAIEWAHRVLAHGFPGLSVDSLVVVIVGQAGRITIDTEDARCQQLVGVCLRALRPWRIHFYGSPSAWGLPGNMEADTGDKFERLYHHIALTARSTMAMMPVPSLSSVDTNGIVHMSMRLLVAHNAHSLLYLRIGCVGPNQLWRLVFGTVGSVVFGQLREIQLTLDINDAQLTEYNINLPHFPCLESLRVVLSDSDVSTRHETMLSIHEHNFLTDLFFCGPSQLRQLSFPLAWNTVELLTPQLLAHIRHLFLREVSLEGEHLLDVDESGQMLAKVLGLQHVRAVHLDSVALKVTLPVLIECSVLRYLVIPFYSLEFGQASELLRQMPTLTLLHCRLVIGSEAATTPDQQQQFHIAHEVSIGSRYYSSTSLRALAVNLLSNDCPEAVRRLAGLVAAQPRLRRVFTSLLHAELLDNFLRSARTRQPLHLNTHPSDNLRIYDIDTYAVF
ncbi:hypothetical protein GGI03_005196 [Coemansia sp. RSA 2337]|nr:hypothetical protein GGI08_005934 [Coemansia sp. S2]KAJ2343701.1 hypothetical protein GGH92_004798 [Coemansia sp. RSA 2673]KAJ2460779.1 hypothetical protein GGI03_005196 [Coemansia sp. RSA 2337]